MPTPLLALLLVLQQPAQQSSPAVARVAITPASPVVVVGDTLRLHARAVDASGRPIEGALILFQPAGGFFEAHVDSAGLAAGVTTGPSVASCRLAPPTSARRTPWCRTGSRPPTCYASG